MFYKKLILPIAALLFFNGYLSADDESDREDMEISMEEHVPVRSRETNPERRRSKTESSLDENEETTRSALPLKKASDSVGNREFILASPRAIRPNFHFANYSYSFPISCHWLKGKAKTGHSFEIEDGSHWEVNPSDAYILRSWRMEDQLYITPNDDWLSCLSTYDYCIRNKVNNSYVQANLVIGPVAFSPSAHWIIDIDHFTGHVLLENQMVWCINPNDSYLLHDWAINDHIIFGLYNSWFSPFDHILINVNVDNYVHAKQY